MTDLMTVMPPGVEPRDLWRHYRTIRARLRPEPPPAPERPKIVPSYRMRPLPAPPAPTPSAPRPELPRFDHVDIDEDIRNVVTLAIELARSLLAGERKIKAIVIATERVFGVPPGHLMHRDRRRAVCVPRQIAMAVAHAMIPSYSLPQLGRYFGGRDHTTVLHASRKYAAIVHRMTGGLVWPKR